MTLHRTLLLIALLAALPAHAATEPTPAEPSPAMRAIAAAETRIAKAAGTPRADAHAALALAQARRARETANTDYYAQAQASLARAEAIAPGNLDAARARIWVLLGQHEFARALEAAQALNKRMPDDLTTYAMLADANIELGRYAEAETNAQWMLDLRPGNIPGLTRAAYLRELFGDVEGALEFMRQAYQGTRESETEDRAWLLTQMAHLQLALGRIDPAARMIDAALKVFPDYHYALAQRARIETARGELAHAARTLQEHVRRAPHPENDFYLGQALRRAGEPAQEVFDRFEQRALAESAGWDNANRELIYYYADIVERPDEALRIAAREIARRQDVPTLEAWAWALHRAGRHGEARAAIDQALAVGTRDAELLRHAGLIARAQGDVSTARKLLNDALASAPWLEDAPALRAWLEIPRA
jgi:tetratricopeptide (TPR) repeat protein